MKKFTQQSLIIASLFTLGLVSGLTIKRQATVQATSPTESASATQVVFVGNYYDYMVITCSFNGNDYLLDDSDNSPYLENGKVIFEEGELVQFTIDENNNVTSVRSIRKDIES